MNTVVISIKTSRIVFNSLILLMDDAVCKHYFDQRSDQCLQSLSSKFLPSATVRQNTESFGLID